MKFKYLHIGFFIVVSCLWVCIATTYAESSQSSEVEWHQWRGPNRDGVSHETGLLTNWPEGGPKEVWRTSLGDGYSSVSISGGRAYTMYAEGEDEVVVCFDAKTGEEIWRYLDDYRFKNRQGGDGPRSTPTVDGDMVYVFSAYGRLVALDAKTGKELWDYDFTKAFESPIPQHGFSASPVVEGNLLLMEAGGKGDRAIIAFNKENGDIVWNTQDDPPAYSSPITVSIHNVRQAIFFTAEGLVSVSPRDGEVYWRYAWRTSYDVNAATPVFIPPDKVFISSGYDTGAALVHVEESDGKLSVSEMWRSRVMKNHFASSILHEGYLYGFDDGTLKCIEANTGEEQWRKRGFRKGSLIYADGHLIVLGESGNLALVKASHTEYIEVAQTQIFDGRCWTAPSVSGGKLYLRNNEELVCLDLTGTEPQ
ncbi:MAG: PQQ-binding-like beta-propeller repeat protein [Candidatus Poribacteria bacterium]|nr:PQQ-binding-like beta-propeller repeat protein [Candidatus Poribacteria bacterium]